MDRIFALNHTLNGEKEIVEITGGVYNMGHNSPSHDLKIEDFYFLNQRVKAKDYIGGELVQFGGVACLISSPTCGEMRGKIYYFFSYGIDCENLLAILKQNEAFIAICNMTNNRIDFDRLKS